MRKYSSSIIKIRDLSLQNKLTSFDIFDIFSHIFLRKKQRGYFGREVKIFHFQEENEYFLYKKNIPKHFDDEWEPREVVRGERGHLGEYQNNAQV